MRRVRVHWVLALAVLVSLGSCAGVALAAAAAQAKPKASTPRASDSKERSAGPRKLEDIHIEGQMPAPQVLFITARDQRRFLDFQHARYLRSARAIGEDVRMPRRFLVSPRGAAPPAEEAR